MTHLRSQTHRALTDVHPTCLGEHSVAYETGSLAAAPQASRVQRPRGGSRVTPSPRRLAQYLEDELSCQHCPGLATSPRMRAQSAWEAVLAETSGKCPELGTWGAC